MLNSKEVVNFIEHDFYVFWEAYPFQSVVLSGSESDAKEVTHLNGEIFCSPSGAISIISELQTCSFDVYRAGDLIVIQTFPSQCNEYNPNLLPPIYIAPIALRNYLDKQKTSGQASIRLNGDSNNAQVVLDASGHLPVYRRKQKISGSIEKDKEGNAIYAPLCGRSEDVKYYKLERYDSELVWVRVL